MHFPKREAVFAMLQLLGDPPEGPQQFYLNHTSPNLIYHAVGPPTSTRARDYSSRAAFLEGGFGRLSLAVRPPGIKFEIRGGLDGLVWVAKRGMAAVIFDTVDTVTLSGVVYEQHYSYHLKFGEDGLITEIWGFLDHGYLDDVLGAELRRLGIE